MKHITAVRIVTIDRADGITSGDMLHYDQRFRQTPLRAVVSHQEVLKYFELHHPEIKKDWLFNQFDRRVWMDTIPTDQTWQLHNTILDGYLGVMGSLRAFLLADTARSIWITNSYIQEFTHHTSLDRNLTLQQRAELLQRYRVGHQAIFKKARSLRIHLRGPNIPTTPTGVRGVKHDNLEQVRVSDLYTHNESIKDSIHWLNHIFTKYDL